MIASIRSIRNPQSAIRNLVESALRQLQKEGLIKEIPKIELDTPSRREHGDLTTNVAMVIASKAGLKPREIANKIIERIPRDSVKGIAVAGPGFINFTIEPGYFIGSLAEIYKMGPKYGTSKCGGGKKIQVEFVSANPTGPLHVGHGRGAVYGDTLANVLKAVGYKVTKEYYLNDVGVQIGTLGRSVWLRVKELQGEEVEFPQECYQGEYIRQIAGEILADEAQSLKLKGQRAEEDKIKFCGDYAAGVILDGIKKDLADLGVTHDQYFSESTLHRKGLIDRAIEHLKRRGKVHEKEGALWFKSTEYGDDKDRVLRKSDGAYTYFAADIAYHQEKFRRGFKRVIDVWGADHFGHVPRMKAAIEALGYDPDSFDAPLIQLVNLVRRGELVSMSTRSAQYETLKTLLNEVGRDVCRYFFLMRSHDAQLDFDLELAKSQSLENPVYYVQYAHARIASVFRKAGIKNQKFRKVNLDKLTLPEEIDLARKLLEYPDVVSLAAKELEPHRVAFYLLELAKLFQAYYTKGKKDERYRFLSEDPATKVAKCYLLKNIQIVLQNGLKLFGIGAPEKMEREEESG